MSSRRPSPAAIGELDEWGHSLGEGTSLGFWFVVRYLLYLVLMLLRLPVQLLRRLLVFPLLAGATAWGLLAGWTSQAALWLGGTGVAIFALAFVFDTVLLWVAPEDLYVDS